MTSGYDPRAAPTVLTQDRGKLAMLNLIGVGIGVLGVWLLQSERGWIAGILSVGLSGFGLVVGIAGIIRPARLTIERSGITFSSMFRTRRWAWEELEDIQLSREYSSDVIFIRTRTASGASGRLRAGVGVFSNGGIPGGWPISTRELYDLLVEAKSRWDPQRRAPPA